MGDGLMDSILATLAFPKPREMMQKDIDTVIRLFVDSVRLMADSGFSGVELHAAHGYLLGESDLHFTQRRYANQVPGGRPVPESQGALG